jgi:chorismate-pyruvate lyase
MIAAVKRELYCGGCQSTPGACAAPAGERCGLCPLQFFYAITAHGMPAITEIAATEMPEPYRQLLVHDNDMTTTLEQFHGGRMKLRVLHSQTTGDVYQREVVLLIEGAQQPVEFGALTVGLPALPAGVETAMVAGRRPLGGILREMGVKFTSRPKAYLRLLADDVMIHALRLPAATTLYGRCNLLLNERGEAFADIVEILPP